MIIRQPKRERNHGMIIETFIQANEDKFIVEYLENYPERAYQINDGNLDYLYNWINNRQEVVINKMINLYEQNLYEQNLLENI